MKEYKIKNIINSPELENVRIGGYASRLASTFFEARIFSDHGRETVFREAESAFTDQNDDETVVGYWRGEFWGKWMISAVRVCRYSHNSQLQNFVHEAALRLIGLQREDGYIGSYRDADNIISPSREATLPVIGWACDWNWNIWCRKYTLWGLLEAYQLTGDARILDGCAKMADHLLAQLKRLNVPIWKTGTFSGMPSCSIMKPMLTLFRLTGDERYLNFCIEIAENWDSADGHMPNLIANALTGRPVLDWYEGDRWGKAYEMLSCLDGLLELYRVTGTQKYLDAVRAMYEILHAHEQNAVFSVGFNDLFSNAASEINAISEPCDVIHWMRLCYELFSLTGESKYMDAFELAYLNPFLAGVFADGMWASRGVRSSGRHLIARQMDYVHNHCCVNNIPRGFMNAAQAAVMNSEKGLYVNLFTDGDASLYCEDGQDVVSIRGSYTVDCRARITVDHQRSNVVKLYIRIPAWSADSCVSVNGASAKPKPGRYFSIELRPWSVTVVDVRFDSSPVIIPFDRPVIAREDDDWKIRRWLNASDKPFAEKGGAPRDAMVFTPRCRLMMGPMLLARSKRIGSTEAEMFGDGTAPDASWNCALSPASGDGQCEFDVQFTAPDGSRISTHMCDYASAANAILDDGHYFSIWL